MLQHCVAFLLQKNSCNKKRCNYKHQKLIRWHPDASDTVPPMWSDLPLSDILGFLPVWNTDHIPQLYTDNKPLFHNSSGTPPRSPLIQSLDKTSGCIASVSINRTYKTPSLASYPVNTALSFKKRSWNSMTCRVLGTPGFRFDFWALRYEYPMPTRLIQEHHPYSLLQTLSHHLQPRINPPLHQQVCRHSVRLARCSRI